MTRLDDVNLLYPPFAEKVNKAIYEARKDKIPVEVFETYRSFDRQDNLYAKGRTTPGPIRTYKSAGMSWHHYGIAVDIVMRVNRRYNWEQTIKRHHTLKIKDSIGWVEKVLNSFTTNYLVSIP